MYKGKTEMVNEMDFTKKRQKDDCQCEPYDVQKKKTKLVLKEEKNISKNSIVNYLSFSGKKIENGDIKKEEVDESKTSLSNYYNNVRTIVTWNLNSITVRYKNREKWNDFMKFFNSINADVLCFQEVRLPAMNITEGKSKSNDVLRDRGKIKNTDQKSLIDFEVMNDILKNDFKNYNAYFSLANIKYSGQLVLVKKGIPLKSIRYNLSFDIDANIHHEEGRIILVEFQEFFLLSTYTPNNGFDKIKFERRRLFDEKLEEFVSFLKNKKSLIWTGDLNIAPEDIDLSHPAEFRKMKKGNVPKEFIGQPGCTDFERKNFRKIMTAGNLVDSYRYLNRDITNGGEITNAGKNAQTKHNINDNIYTWRCPFLIGKQCNKAMRIDHFIVSKNFLTRVEKVEIHGYGVSHNNFYGSDHCPVILRLNDPPGIEEIGKTEETGDIAT
ncbi:AP endonuclease (DNA-[apurinic or apyrimidinic site] lyase), putative [Plasmodium ovale curtisi]|uniref:DNA-(apurinic or apyrimidinic site) endonuclease n=1 Tax=Plasmodium ovale curtisi TaxID=864141 RepID=A0A1A8WE36_PLAOA|nr:AP endonuclease (DNA-[apurinic or apyrimidinic site] lyase), putative [Plasmodium ovale curtisi]SBS90036.1 AP endonuclease (DNA-[apurinic or apyrimidinic site] lyase), putative [Plasmodium ovale curtisi]